ncbi:MAG: chemotaxis protein CheB [Desulfamplus sp.]|nr:chemotaxis protein CheB [Desulfamplus sp.]
MTAAIKAVVIGVSAGGFNALHRILPIFQHNLSIPIIIVQHRKADFESYLTHSLNERCQMPVKEPLDKTNIESGTIYIAPGGYHLLIEKRDILKPEIYDKDLLINRDMILYSDEYSEYSDEPSNRDDVLDKYRDFHFALSVDPPVCYCRPSIDVLFESAADAFGSALIGVILTGANFDGAEGIKKIKSLGGITIAENPETAEVNYMPSCAIKTNAVDYILDLDEIPIFIQKLLNF